MLTKMHLLYFREFKLNMFTQAEYQTKINRLFFRSHLAFS